MGEQPVSAKEISVLAERNIGWNKAPIYVIKLEQKGYIERRDPGFICTSLISKIDVQKEETNGLLAKIFGGSKKALFSVLLEDESLSEEEIRELRDMIEKR